MSFDLRIHFVGLNLFVPEEPSRMHVLLPSSKGHKQHHARLIFDEAYLDPKKKELTRTYNHIKIDGRVVDFTGVPVAEATIDTHLPAEIPSIAKFIEPLERSLVTSMPDPERLDGRVSVSSGALGFYGLGARFFSLEDGKPQRMPARLEWTIRGITSMEAAESGARAVLPARDLMGVDGSIKKLPNLYPIGNTIHLLVFHAISEEFPPHGEDFKILKPTKDEADHFKAYYSVVKKGEVVASKPVPKTTISESVTCTGDKVKKDGDETPGHTCLGAQARLADSFELAKEARAETEEDSARGDSIPISHHVV